MGLTAGDILHFQLEGTRSLAPLKNEGLLSFYQLQPNSCDNQKSPIRLAKTQPQAPHSAPPTPLANTSLFSMSVSL